jgi:hypothetical protein
MCLLKNNTQIHLVRAYLPVCCPVQSCQADPLAELEAWQHACHPYRAASDAPHIPAAPAPCFGTHRTSARAPPAPLAPAGPLGARVST